MYDAFDPRSEILGLRLPHFRHSICKSDIAATTRSLSAMHVFGYGLSILANVPTIDECTSSASFCMLASVDCLSITAAMAEWVGPPSTMVVSRCSLVDRCVDWRPGDAAAADCDADVGEGGDCDADGTGCDADVGEGGDSDADGIDCERDLQRQHVVPPIIANTGTNPKTRVPTKESALSSTTKSIAPGRKGMGELEETTATRNRNNKGEWANGREHCTSKPKEQCESYLVWAMTEANGPSKTNWQTMGPKKRRKREKKKK